MGKKLKHMKQVLTVVLTMAMIFTSVPQNVLAAELNSELLQEDEIFYDADEAGETLIEDGTTEEGLIEEAPLNDGTIEDLFLDQAGLEEDNEVEATGDAPEVLSGNAVISFIVSEEVKEIKYIEYDPTGETQIGSEITLSESSISSGCIVKKGDTVRITGLTCGSAETDMIYAKNVKAGSNDLGDYARVANTDQDRIDLGVVDADLTVTVTAATLPVSNIEFKITSGNEISVDAEYDGSYTVSIGDDKYINMYTVAEYYDLDVDLFIKENTTPYDYRFKTPATYTIEGKDPGNIDIISYSTDYYVACIPGDVVAAAAFAGKPLKVQLVPEKLGNRKQFVKVWRDNDDGSRPADVSVKVNGETMYWYLNYGTSAFWVPNNSTADVTVSPRAGYTLNKVCCIWDTDYKLLSGNEAEKKAAITGANPPDGVTVIQPQSGSTSFTVPNLQDGFQVFVVEDASYALLVNNQPAESGKIVDVAYNADSADYPYFAVCKGSALEELSIANVSANILSGNTAVDVTSDVFGEVITGSPITFNPTSSKVWGKTVNVSIKRDGAEGDPGFEYTLKFNVSRPITAQTVGFSGDVTNILGTSNTITLTTTSDYKPGTVGVAITGYTGDDLTASLGADGKTVTVKSNVTGRNAGDLRSLTTNNNIGLKLYDLNDTGKAAISENKLTVTVAQVNDTVLSGNIVLNPGSDAIKLDLSKVKLAAPQAEGLYYELHAERTVSSSELKEELKGMAPATIQQGVFYLAVDDDSYEPNAISYNVSVRLVQVTTAADQIGNAAKTADLVACSGTDKQFAEYTATVPDGTFATGIKFNKSKDKTVAGRLYDTYDKKLVIGTITYDKIGKDLPTVQRISKVEIDGKEDRSIVYENFGKIYLNPAKAGAGKHTIVAYAVEPKGISVTSKPYTFTVERGINNISIEAPWSLFKTQNKKATYTIGLTSTGKDGKVISGADKKVTWSLVDNDDKPFTYPGVEFKKGKLTLDKNLTLPENGLYFWIKAAANDHPDNQTVETKYIEIRGISDAPEHIYVNGTELVEGESYTTNQLAGAFYANDSNMNYLSDVKFKVTGLNTAKINGEKHIFVGKPDIKKVTVTAEKTDGSGLKKSVTFSVKSDVNMSGGLLDGNYDYIAGHQAGFTVSGTNLLPADKPMMLIIGGANGGLTEHSIKVTGAKKKEATWVYNTNPADDLSTATLVYFITPTAPKTDIIVTEKSTGKELTFNITNTMVASAKTSISVTGSNKYADSYDAKKKSLKLKDNKGNIFNALYFDETGYAASGSCNRVTYTVKSGKSPANGNVRVSIDDPALLPVFDHNANINGKITKVAQGEYKVELANGQFDIDYAFATQSSGTPKGATFYVPSGKYSFTVTPIDESGAATGKTASFKFKASPAPKAKVTVNATKFKNFSSQADIGFKTLTNIAWNGSVSSAAFTGTLGNNNKGVISSFKTTFAAADGKLTCTNAVKDSEKKSITGWVVYSWTNLDGSTGTGYSKVTVEAAKDGEITPKPIN